MAHTLLSTSPVASPKSRTTFSSRSVTSPLDRFGQATHSPPAVVSRCRRRPEPLPQRPQVRREREHDVVRRAAGPPVHLDAGQRAQRRLREAAPARPSAAPGCRA